jgi:antitoxin VapB
MAAGAQVSGADVVSPRFRVAVFMNRSNQSVRIPKEVGFDGIKELELQRIGDVITLRPPKPSWDEFFDQARAAAVGDDPWAERREVLDERSTDWGNLMEGN